MCCCLLSLPLLLLAQAPPGLLCPMLLRPWLPSLAAPPCSSPSSQASQALRPSLSLPPPSVPLLLQSSEFESSLALYIEQLRLPAAAARTARELMQQHDFSPARAHLVASVPGYHTGAVHSHEWCWTWPFAAAGLCMLWAVGCCVGARCCSVCCAQCSKGGQQKRPTHRPLPCLPPCCRRRAASVG